MTVTWEKVGFHANGQIFLTAAGGWPRTTTGCSEPTKVETTTNKNNYYVLDFATGADEYAQWVLAMPGDWDASTVTAVFYWTAASGSGTVQFACGGISYADSDALDAAITGHVACTADTLLTAGDVHITVSTGAITIAGGAAASELVMLEVYRDVSGDTLDVDARLLGVMITYGRT